MQERTTRRIKALELQNAIKAQVEERERLRKMELEKVMLEERRQEEKLRQQMESNELRFEEEQRKTREKLEREQRKQEMMRLAIEKARQEAEMERAKRKRPICTTSECESPEQSDELHDDLSTTRTIHPQSTIHTPPVNVDADTDDGEQILIGTPIKMKKKTLNKPVKISASAKKEVSIQSEKDVTTTSETNVDGIALVLQTLPPIMPILSNDILNLNQNINTLNTNNIQLAVMLAQQMQQLNNITQNQNQHPNQNHNQIAPLEIVGSKSKEQAIETSDEKYATFTRNEVNETTANDNCQQCPTNGLDRSNPKDEQVRIVCNLQRNRVPSIKYVRLSNAFRCRLRIKRRKKMLQP